MANKKHNWTWKFRLANERNLTLLINLKKHLQFRDISEQTIFEYQKDIYGFMISCICYKYENMKKYVESNENGVIPFNIFDHKFIDVYLKRYKYTKFYNKIATTNIYTLLHQHTVD